MQLVLDKPSAQLRKANRIKTIQSTLGIEGNTLSEEQITAIIENKRVAGPIKDLKLGVKLGVFFKSGDKKMTSYEVRI